MWTMRTNQNQSDDLKTRITLCEQICDQLAQSTKRAEQDSHDRALKEQETLLTLSRVADGLNNLSSQVVTNRDFFEKVIDKNNTEVRAELENVKTELGKNTNFINSARWGFTALWAFVSAIGLDIIGQAVKHFIK